MHRLLMVLALIAIASPALAAGRGVASLPSPTTPRRRWASQTARRSMRHPVRRACRARRRTGTQWNWDRTPRSSRDAARSGRNRDATRRPDGRAAVPAGGGLPALAREHGGVGPSNRRLSRGKSSTFRQGRCGLCITTMGHPQATSRARSPHQRSTTLLYRNYLTHIPPLPIAAVKKAVRVG